MYRLRHQSRPLPCPRNVSTPTIAAAQPDTISITNQQGSTKPFNQSRSARLNQAIIHSSSARLLQSHKNTNRKSSRVMATLATELPFAIVAKDDHLNMVCSWCFASKNDRPISRCSGCRVLYYCTEECQRQDWVNHRRECSFLAESAPFVPYWKCRLIARISLKLRHPELAKKTAFNGRAFADLMDHRDEMLKHPERLLELAIVKPMLNQYMGEKFVPDSDLLLSIFGKVHVNTYSIVGNIYGPGIGLYIGLSVHDHSCVSSVFITFDGPKAILRSPKKDQNYSMDLTVSYVDLLTPNVYRKGYLRSMYYFDCACSRCSDPTFDFLCNSAYSACCPDSYCPLDPDGQELTCFNCGTVSETTIKDVIAANSGILPLGDKIRDENAQESDKSKYVQSLVNLYDKFSKGCPPEIERQKLGVLLLIFQLGIPPIRVHRSVLSPFNVQLWLINDRLFVKAMEVGDRRVCGKYARLLLPAIKRYLPVGHPELSPRLEQIATAVSNSRAPLRKMNQITEKVLKSGHEHSDAESMKSIHQARLQEN